MIRGIELLEADNETKTIVLISKPPAPSVATRILNRAKNAKKPVVVNFLGADASLGASARVRVARTLEEAASLTCSVSRGTPTPRNSEGIPSELLDSAKEEWSRLASSQRYVRGLFAGGTLCYESQVILGPLLRDVYSNGPIRPELKIDGEAPSKKHVCIDMGADEFVEGRLHPMIDFTLRNKRILKEATDRETAVVLLDVELGFGSNPDPAGQLAPVIERAKGLAHDSGRSLSIVASLVATEGDFQGIENQEKTLRDVGVLIAPSNASTTRLAALIATRGSSAVSAGRQGGK